MNKKAHTHYKPKGRTLSRSAQQKCYDSLTTSLLVKKQRGTKSVTKTTCVPARRRRTVRGSAGTCANRLKTINLLALNSHCFSKSQIGQICTQKGCAHIFRFSVTPPQDITSDVNHKMSINSLRDHSEQQKTCSCLNVNWHTFNGANFSKMGTSIRFLEQWWYITNGCTGHAASSDSSDRFLAGLTFTIHYSTYPSVSSLVIT